MAQNKNKIIKKFHSVCLSIFKTFKSFNRFTQAIIKHLLTMKAIKSKINLLLIRELFGEMAIIKFNLNGEYNEFKNEKQELIRLFSGHISIVDLINSNKKLSEKKINIKSENFNLSSKIYFAFNFWDVEYRKKNSTNRTFNCARISDLSIGLRNCNIDCKYLDHFHWLKRYFGEDSIQAVSFRNLLNDVYQIND